MVSSVCSVSVEFCWVRLNSVRLCKMTPPSHSKKKINTVNGSGLVVTVYFKCLCETD